MKVFVLLILCCKRGSALEAERSWLLRRRIGGRSPRSMVVLVRGGTQSPSNGVVDDDVSRH
jgi:hypothetical protein